MVWVLKPFQDVTVIASFHKANLAQAIPLVYRLDWVMVSGFRGPHYFI